ncbi:hypothetical protein BAT_3607 [Bacillus pumilus ATCC 7061]|nr:hypothetical protein BAT_3607 [Bacillus pumilus ATCC 7061]
MILSKWKIGLIYDIKEDFLLDFSLISKEVTKENDLFQAIY